MKRGTTALTLLVALALLTAGAAVLSVTTSAGNHATAASTLRDAADATLESSFTAEVTETADGTLNHQTGHARIVYEAPNRLAIYRTGFAEIVIGTVVYVQVPKSARTPAKDWTKISRSERTSREEIGQIRGWLTMLRQADHVVQTSDGFQARSATSSPLTLDGPKTLPTKISIVVRDGTVVSERIVFSAVVSFTGSGVPAPTRFVMMIRYNDIGDAPAISPPPAREIMRPSS